LEEQPNVVEQENSIMAMRLKETFGKEKLNITSKKLNVSIATIGYWKSGKTKPDLDKIVKICEVYKVSSDWLLGIPGANKVKEKGVDAASECTGLSEDSMRRVKHSKFQRELQFLLDDPNMEKFLETMAKISGHAYGLEMTLEDIKKLKSNQGKKDPYAREKTSEMRGSLRTAINGVRLHRYELSDRALDLADSIYSLEPLLERSKEVLDSLDEEMRFLSEIF